MLAGSVAAAIAIYILFAAHVNAHRGRAIESVEPIPLPVDAIVVYPYGVPLRELESSVHVERAVPVVTVDVGGPWGRLPLVGLPYGDDVWDRLALAEGRLPGPGEVLVPDVAGFPQPGAEAQVLYVGGPRSVSATLRVVGVYQAANMPAPWPLTASETLTALGAQPNMAWVTLSDPGRGADALRGIGRPLSVLAHDTPARLASRVVSDVYRPFRTVILMVFVLSGLGVLNIMLLGFLERKKSLGIFKACGLQSMEMMLLLLLEAVATATVGILVGASGGILLVHALRERAGASLVLAPGDVVTAGIAALVVAALGAYVPARLGQRTTVLDLVSGR